MHFNFELILFYAVVITGAISLLDRAFLAPKRKQILATQEVKLPIIIDYARSFFPVLIIVFLLRSFLFEPFRIPSGSLEPTLLIGDFILVNKFHYGIRLPIVHRQLLSIATPKRGDIMVLRWPPNPSIDFIKRVIGLPGDHLSYIDKVLYINGQKIPQEFLESNVVHAQGGDAWNVIEKQEDLLGVKHKIYVRASQPSYDYRDVVVPPGMYFVMGDNRDDSADSRYWGFVPTENIVGQAVAIWMSWDSVKHIIRWNRLMTKIN